MDSDSDGDRNTQRPIINRRSKCSDALGKIVDGNGERRHNAHTHELRIVRTALHLLDEVRFVRIFNRRHEPVDDTDQQP